MREFMATYAEVYGLSQDQLDAPRAGSRLHEPRRQHGVGGVRAAHQRPAGVSGIDPRGLHRGGPAGANDGAAGARPGGRRPADHGATLSAAAAVSRAAANVGWQVPEASLTEKAVEAGGTQRHLRSRHDGR